MGQKNFGSKNFWVNKIFGSKKCLGQKKIWAQKMIMMIIMIQASTGERCWEDGTVGNHDLFRRGIWSMDEDEIVEMGKQMVDIHQASKYVS